MKVLWQDLPEKWVPYDKEIHLKEAWIFIYWDQEEVLLIGWSHDFERSFTEKFRRHLWHRDLFEMADDSAPKRNPDGAGRIWNGKIDNWGSSGFNLFTPESMRPKILKALGIE